MTILTEIQSILLIGLTYILIGQYGLIGAGRAWVATYAIMTVIMAANAKKGGVDLKADRPFDYPKKPRQGGIYAPIILAAVLVNDALYWIKKKKETPAQALKEAVKEYF